MIGQPSGTRVWLAAGMTDMRRGFRWPGQYRPGETGRRLLRWSCLRLSWPARRSGQTALVGWRRPVPLCQAPGTWSFQLATSHRGFRPSLNGPALYASRRYRLAPSGTDLETGAHRVKKVKTFLNRAVHPRCFRANSGHVLRRFPTRQPRRAQGAG